MITCIAELSEEVTALTHVNRKGIESTTQVPMEHDMVSQRYQRLHLLRLPKACKDI